MKSCVVAASVLLLAALSSSAVHAQSRVSVEVGGMVSAYDVPGSPGVTQGAIMIPSGTVNSVTGASGGTPGQGIAAFEVRPSVALDGGLLFGVGFRAGQAGIGNSSVSSTSLVGADVMLGFQHKFGPFLPFVAGTFGVNSYDIPGSVDHSTRTDLRVDGVLGARLYVSRKLYLAASAFAGWGDRYGGAVTVGGDVIQVFRRGVMP